MRWQVLEDDPELEEYQRALRRNLVLRATFKSLANKHDNTRYVWTDFTDIFIISRWLKEDPEGDRFNKVCNLAHNIRIENIHLAGALSRIQARRSCTIFLIGIVGATGLNFAFRALIPDPTVIGVLDVGLLGMISVLSLWFARKATFMYPELLITTKEPHE